MVTLNRNPKDGYVKQKPEASKTTAQGRSETAYQAGCKVLATKNKADFSRRLLPGYLTSDITSCRTDYNMTTHDN